MSHTYHIGERWTVICNSDFSGPITVLDMEPVDEHGEKREDQSVQPYIIDIELIEGIVAHIIRTKKIAELEQMSDEELIYWGTKA